MSEAVLHEARRAARGGAHPIPAALQGWLTGRVASHTATKRPREPSPPPTSNAERRSQPRVAPGAIKGARVATLPAGDDDAEEVEGESLRLFQGFPDAGEWCQGFLAAVKRGYDATAILTHESAPGWVEHAGLHYRNGAIVVPEWEKCREHCITQYHDPPCYGHPGPKRTEKAILR